MKRLGAVFAISLAVAPASANTWVTPDYIGLMKSVDDAIVEGTVVSGALNTWRDAKGEHVCGRTFEIAVNEVLWGKAAPRERLSERLWFPREHELRDLATERPIAVGATYVFSIHHAAIKPEASDTPPPDSAEGACLKDVPKDLMGAATQVYLEPSRPGESWSGMPGKGREYVRIPVTRAIEDNVVFGAFYERFYAKTSKVDPNARAYLSEDGIYPPPEAKGLDGKYLEDNGRNGPQWIFYDAVVSYDDFKRLIRDPNRQPIYRLN